MNVAKIIGALFSDNNEVFFDLIKTIHHKQFSTYICVQFEQP